MHIRIIELEKAQIAESMLGFIMKRYPPGEFLIVFDENVIEEPLWVRESDWDELMGMRHNIKVKNFTYYDNLGPKRDTRLPIAGQELDFSSVLSDQEDLESKGNFTNQERNQAPSQNTELHHQRKEAQVASRNTTEARASLLNGELKHYSPANTAITVNNSSTRLHWHSVIII